MSAGDHLRAAPSHWSRHGSREEENTITISRGALILVTTLTVLGHPAFLTPARAAGSQDRAQETLAAVSAVLRDPALQGADSQPERRRRVRKIIYDTFYFDEMARESLGPTWDRLTPAQRAEFVRLFGNLFEGSYNRLVLRFLGDRQAIYDAVADCAIRCLRQRRPGPRARGLG